MNVQDDGPSTVVLAQAKPLVPGYLVTPFGWAAQQLAAMIQSEPRLLTHVFELDRPRMHVIALALAHLDESPASDLATVLFRGSIHEVLHRVAVCVHGAHGPRRLRLDDDQLVGIAHGAEQAEDIHAVLHVGNEHEAGHRRRQRHPIKLW